MGVLPQSPTPPTPPGSSRRPSRLPRPLLPVPVPARAGRRRHPVSQVAPSLSHQPASGPRPTHPGELTEAKRLSSCLHASTRSNPADTLRHPGRLRFSSGGDSNGSAKQRSAFSLACSAFQNQDPGEWLRRCLSREAKAKGAPQGVLRAKNKTTKRRSTLLIPLWLYRGVKLPLKVHFTRSDLRQYARGDVTDTSFLQC